MKSLLQYINESLDKQTLSEEFKTTLNSLFNDWDKNFKAQYSLNFIYNILVEACKGKKAIFPINTQPTWRDFAKLES